MGVKGAATSPVNSKSILSILTFLSKTMYLEGNGRQDSRQVQSQVFLWPHHILRSHNHMCVWIIVNTPLSVCGLKPYSLSPIIIFSMPRSWPW